MLYSNHTKNVYVVTVDVIINIILKVSVCFYVICTLEMFYVDQSILFTVYCVNDFIVLCSFCIGSS